MQTKVEIIFRKELPGRGLLCGAILKEGFLKNGMKSDINGKSTKIKYLETSSKATDDFNEINGRVGFCLKDIKEEDVSVGDLLVFTDTMASKVNENPQLIIQKQIRSSQVKKDFMLFLIVLVIVFLGAFFLPKLLPLIKNNEVIPDQEIDKEKIVYEEKINSENYDDWQTYKNEEYGFEIKYPDNWNVTRNIMSFEPDLVFCPSDLVDLKPELNCRRKTVRGSVQYEDGMIYLFVNTIQLEHTKNPKYHHLGFWNGEDYDLLSDDANEAILNQMLSTFGFIEEEVVEERELPKTIESSEVDIEKDQVIAWETYRNEEYEYEVKYPLGWLSFGELLGGFNITSPTIDGSSYNRIFVTANGKEGEESNEEYIDNIIKNNTLPGYQELKTKKEVIINNIQSYEIVWNMWDSEMNQFRDGGLRIYIEAPQENKTRFVVAQFSGKGPQYEENLKIFNQMLSTLKFLE